MSCGNRQLVDKGEDTVMLYGMQRWREKPERAFGTGHTHTQIEALPLGNVRGTAHQLNSDHNINKRMLTGGG